MTSLHLSCQRGGRGGGLKGGRGDGHLVHKDAVTDAPAVSLTTAFNTRMPLLAALLRDWESLFHGHTHLTVGVCMLKVLAAVA